MRILCKAIITNAATINLKKKKTGKIILIATAESLAQTSVTRASFLYVELDAALLDFTGPTGPA